MCGDIFTCQDSWEGGVHASSIWGLGVSEVNCPVICEMILSNKDFSHL